MDQGGDGMNLTPQNEKAALAGAASGNQLPPTKRLNPTTKKAAMVRHFLAAGDVGINCFYAANHLHDYVLRTTVSELGRYYGLTFNRKFEQVPNDFGSKTDCMRYWLAPESRGKARFLIGEVL